MLTDEHAAVWLRLQMRTCDRPKRPQCCCRSLRHRWSGCRKFQNVPRRLNVLPQQTHRQFMCMRALKSIMFGGAGGGARGQAGGSPGAGRCG